GRLGVSAESAAPATRSRIKRKMTSTRVRVLNPALSFAMDLNTVLLSDQKVDSFSGIFSSSFISMSIFTATAAAVSSNLRMAVCFKGDTRDFPIKNKQWASPLPFMKICQHAIPSLPRVCKMM
ncbi:hypothetical protein XENOCAPTIV_024206, partial [Xenoophorus captivus]